MSKRLVWTLAAVVCALVIAAPAQAKTDRVIGGHARVTPSMQITAFLRSRGITVTPIGAMKLGTGSLTMPMVSGQVDTRNMQGTMVTSGGIQYTNGSKKVRVQGYRLIHNAHGAKLTAVVNGRRIVLATMTAPRVKMSGKRGTMTGALKLSAAWAQLINHLVGTRVVHPGEDLGDLTATIRMA